MKFTTAIASAILGFVAGSATAAAVPRGANEANGIIEVLSADKVNEAKGNGIIEVLSADQANEAKGNGIIEVLSADKANEAKGNGIIEVLSADQANEAKGNGIIEVLSADKANEAKGNGIIEVLSADKANEAKGNGIIEVLSADNSNETKGDGIIEVLSADKKGGFGESCHNPRLTSRIINENQHIYSVHATCSDNKDGWVRTHIQLNRCLKNDDGDLAWANVGYFDDSCKECVITTNDKDESEVLLTCTCIGARDNRPTPSTINLNDGIRNNFGVIWCGQQTGYIEN